MTRIMEWYRSLVDEAAVNAVAEKSGLVQSTLSRQVRSGSLSHETVVAVARAYGADVLDALIITGLISPDDIRRHGVNKTLQAALDIELAAEIMRRAQGGNRPVFDAPIQ